MLEFVKQYATEYMRQCQNLLTESVELAKLGFRNEDFLDIIKDQLQLKRRRDWVFTWVGVEKMQGLSYRFSLERERLLNDDATLETFVNKRLKKMGLRGFSCGYCKFEGFVSETSDYTRCPSCGGM